ncbi:co-chaperone GroES, partial [Klebsiella pneumoniae]|nr:co-chaperone GroES [Klebsiella pneumoniae]
MTDAKLEIQMLHDRVMVRVSQESGERRSSGGIVIPATAQVAKRLVWGEVFGVGSHGRSVKVGDQVLFNPEEQYEGEGQ